MSALLVHDVVATGSPTHWVLVLHGLGDSKEGWKPVADYLRGPDTGWIFAQAPDAYHDGWSWFDMRRADPTPDPTTVTRSADLVRALLTHLEATRGIGCENLTLMGFSQGCLLTLEVALTHARRFRAVVGISGWINRLAEYPGRFGAAARDQRILMTHGLHDPVIPIILTRPQVTALQGLGLALTWREYAKAHNLDPEREIGDLRNFLNAPTPNVQV